MQQLDQSQMTTNKEKYDRETGVCFDAYNCYPVFFVQTHQMQKMEMQVLSVWIAKNPPGFAFVTFKSADEAQTAIKEAHGLEVDFAEDNGRGLRVEGSTYAQKRHRGGGGRGASSRGRDSYRDRSRGRRRDSRSRGRGGGGGYRSRRDSRGGRGGRRDRDSRQRR
ncbi:unnamed protein product [Amoebophrya sp. A120]|nr:unnamed protein product [Amoebophrya sp. A120]|eukprot:GSA120T00012640001.1